MWAKKDLKNHKKSAKLLSLIKDMAFKYISENKNISEYGVQQFILTKFKEYGLKIDKDPPIVAFGKNTAKVHYFPNKRCNILKQNQLILIDLWANFKSVRSPFADITWMAYNGKKIPKEIEKVWGIITEIINEIIKYLRRRLKNNSLPQGREINDITKNIMSKHGFHKQDHFTGHSIGFTSPHGNKASLRPSNTKPLEKNLGYTIEPGIYMKNKFGMRNEIDFYINKKNKLVITTEIQKKIVLL